MIERLHFITKDHPELSHVELCRIACEAGVPLVQYRNKSCSSAQFREEARACRDITRMHGAKLIINDQLDIALEVEADGVHLGLTDLSTAEARARAGNDFIIGGTANTLEDVLQHYENGVNYVGVGPFRFTTTKKALSPVLGLEGYAVLVKELALRGIHLPIIAIGGIVAEDVAALRRTGVHGIAVSGMIADAQNRISTTYELLKRTRYESLEDWR